MLQFARRRFATSMDYAERLRLSLLGRRPGKQSKHSTGEDEQPKKLTQPQR